MAITPMSADMAIISALNDEPNDVTGLTAAELKAKFDEAGQTLKTYINETLLPGLTAANVVFAPTAGVPGAQNAQSAIEAVQAQIVAMTLGQIPDGAITAQKLSAGVQEDIASRAEVQRFTAVIPAEDFSQEAPFTASVSVPGLLETDAPHITRVLAHDSTDEGVTEAWNLVTDIIAHADSLAVYASEAPVNDIPIEIEVVR